jgi:hypothetical protein
MSKKTNKKKKVNIKLESGQSYLIEDLEIILNIQKIYAGLTKGQISDEDRNIYNRVMAAVANAVGNVYHAVDDGAEDEDYWA